MKRITVFCLMVGFITAVTAWSQTPDFAVFPGDEERPRSRERHRADRLDRMVEYLELSEAQTVEWQAIVGRHLEAAEARRDRVGALREEFRQLAEQADPNLEQVGQIALDMHREMESLRSGRNEMVSELETVLTPEQAEKFAALKAAREMARPRGRRGDRPHRGDLADPD